MKSTFLLPSPFLTYPWSFLLHSSSVSRISSTYLSRFALTQLFSLSLSVSYPLSDFLSLHDLIVVRLFSRELRRNLLTRTVGSVGLWQLTMSPSRWGWGAKDTALSKVDSVVGQMMKKTTSIGPW